MQTRTKIAVNVECRRLGKLRNSTCLTTTARGIVSILVNHLIRALHTIAVWLVFGLLSNMAVAGADNTEKAMKMAQQEMDYRVDLYNRFAGTLMPSLAHETSAGRAGTQPVLVYMQNGCLML